MKPNVLLATICLIAAVSCSQSADKNATSNEVIENIMARRSIRKYKAEKVDRETVLKIMECGINAPSGQNKQSWEVRIIDDPALLNEISEAMGESHPDNAFAKDCFRGAPVMVFIARDPSYDFSAYDCGMLAQNIMLSAWSLGIGSVCLGSPVRFMTDNELCIPYIDMLNFTDGYEFCLCIGLGYADESPEAKPRDMGKVAFTDLM